MNATWIETISEKITKHIIDELIDSLSDNLPEIEIRNDGIGYYEYWGAPGFDKGEDYPVITGNEIAEITVYLPFPISYRLWDKIQFDIEDEIDSNKEYTYERINLEFELLHTTLLEDHEHIEIVIKWSNIEMNNDYIEDEDYYC